MARNCLLSSSRDGEAQTFVWDCTAGRFNWYYGGDETVYVLEGSVTIIDDAGVTRRVGPGDSVFFPAGSRAEWTVDHYVRKVAFCRNPMPKQIMFAKKLVRALKRLTRLGTSEVGAPAPFPGG